MAVLYSCHTAGVRGSPVAGIPFRDTLPLQMLTQRILNSNIAFGSFIVKYRRSHIFPHRNTRTGCLHRSRSLFRGRSFAPLGMIPENKQTSPAGKAARAGFPIRRALGRRRHLAIDEPKAKTELSTAASRRQARAVLRIGIPATGLPKSTCVIT